MEAGALSLLNHNAELVSILCCFDGPKKEYPTVVL